MIRSKKEDFWPPGMWRLATGAPKPGDQKFFGYFFSKK
jgi:hypothetical protein